MNMNSLQCCCWHRGVVLHLRLLRKGLFTFFLQQAAWRLHNLLLSLGNEHTHWGRWRLCAPLPRFPLKLCGDFKWKPSSKKKNSLSGFYVWSWNLMWGQLNDRFSFWAQIGYCFCPGGTFREAVWTYFRCVVAPPCAIATRIPPWSPHV